MPAAVSQFLLLGWHGCWAGCRHCRSAGLHGLTQLRMKNRCLGLSGLQEMVLETIALNPLPSADLQLMSMQHGSRPAVAHLMTQAAGHILWGSGGHRSSRTRVVPSLPLPSPGPSSLQGACEGAGSRGLRMNASPAYPVARSLRSSPALGQPAMPQSLHWLPACSWQHSNPQPPQHNGVTAMVLNMPGVHCALHLPVPMWLPMLSRALPDPPAAAATSKRPARACGRPAHSAPSCSCRTWMAARARYVASLGSTPRLRACA